VGVTPPHGAAGTGNVLVIMADEHAARVAGFAGHSVVQTPHLDRLASEGTVFERAWTPSPICVPARGAFATGRWVHEVGTWHSAQPYTGEPGGWAHAARFAGATVVSVGKLHYRSGDDDIGHYESRLPMWVVDGIGWVQGLSRRPLAEYPEAAEMAAEVGVGETSYTRYDRRIGAAASDWLRTEAPADRPWVLFASFVAPHYPLSAPERFDALYSDADVPDPEIPEVEIHNPAVAAARSFWSQGDHFDAQLTRRARRAYYGLCSFVDQQVGELMRALDESGQAGDTTVIYTSDHGELLGNRGLWAKSFMYEDSVRIPLVVRGPGFDAGSRCATYTNLVDIAPTIAETVGADLESGPGAASLRDIAAGALSDRPAFSEYHDGGSITGTSAVAWDRWKYVHHVGFAPELFDLRDDPDELVDLGTDPGYAHSRAEGEEVLRSIVDPDDADRRAFESQAELVEQLGGVDALAKATRFDHTPAPH